MSIYVVCRCGQAFSAPSQLAGTTARCSTCGQSLLVPIPSIHGTSQPNLAPAPQQRSLPLPSPAHAGIAAQYAPSPEKARENRRRAIIYLAGGAGALLVTVLLLCVGTIGWLASQITPPKEYPVAATPYTPGADPSRPALPSGYLVRSPGGEYEFWLPTLPQGKTLPALSLVGLESKSVGTDVEQPSSFILMEASGDNGMTQQALYEEFCRVTLKKVQREATGTVSSTRTVVLGMSAQEYSADGVRNGRRVKLRVVVVNAHDKTLMFMFAYPNDSDGEQIAGYVLSSFRPVR